MDINTKLESVKCSCAVTYRRGYAQWEKYPYCPLHSKTDCKHLEYRPVKSDYDSETGTVITYGCRDCSHTWEEPHERKFQVFDLVRYKGTTAGTFVVHRLGPPGYITVEDGDALCIVFPSTIEHVPDAQYGDVEVSEEDFKPEACSRRLSLMVPENVLNDLAIMADAEGRELDDMVIEILKAYLG